MKLFGQNQLALTGGMKLVGRPIVRDEDPLAALQQNGALYHRKAHCTRNRPRGGKSAALLVRRFFCGR